MLKATTGKSQYTAFFLLISITNVLFRFFCCCDALIYHGGQRDVVQLEPSEFASIPSAADSNLTTSSCPS